MPGVSEISLQDTKVQPPKRRGRGTFSYKKPELYSDQLSDKSIINDAEDEDVCHSAEGKKDTRNGKSYISFNSSLHYQYCVMCLV